MDNTVYQLVFKRGRIPSEGKNKRDRRNYAYHLQSDLTNHLGAAKTNLSRARVPQEKRAPHPSTLLPLAES